MRTDLLEALELKFEAEKLAAEANIQTYMTQSVGIGEHPDLVEAVETQITRLAEANERLDTVRELLHKNG